MLCIPAVSRWMCRITSYVDTGLTDDQSYLNAFICGCKLRSCCCYRRPSASIYVQLHNISAHAHDMCMTCTWKHVLW